MQKKGETASLIPTLALLSNLLSKPELSHQWTSNLMEEGRRGRGRGKEKRKKGEGRENRGKREHLSVILKIFAP